MFKFLSIVACGTWLALLAGCSSTSADTRVAVVVELPRPATTNDLDLTHAFVAGAQRYEAVRGLQRKYFVFSDDTVGGVYLWENQDAANNFFSDDWKTRMETTFGNPATLTWFEVVSEVEGMSYEDAGSGAVVSVVRVSAPWYAPRGIIRDRMIEAMPEYTSIDGLDYKYFTIASERKIGGIYLWESDDAAKEFFNEAWHQRIQDRYGEAADLQFFYAPVTVLNGQASQKDR
ncbi:MAG: hypothetical protein AAGC71_08365 [Pseudomonadota bacterium]